MFELKEAVITVRGSQDYGEGEDNAVKLVTEGFYGYSEDFIKITYMETELTGLQVTMTTFEIRPKNVIISRQGMLASQMMFEEGKRYSSMYQTPYGSVMMGIDTQRIYNTLGEHGGELQIHYVVDFNHSMVGKNSFRITVKEISY